MASGVTTCKGGSLRPIGTRTRGNPLYEVLFKRYHVTHFPWGKNDETISSLGFSEVPFQNVTVQVTRLCHATHNVEAERIDQGDAFVFKPKKKLGKPSSTNRKTLVICDPTDRAPTDETLYRQISENEQVLPGCYVWWSIDNSCFPAKQSDDPYLYQQPFLYKVSDDFTIPYQSCFGNKKFSVDFNELLQCYQETHRSKWLLTLPRIELRCGSTQRYNRQICKVIIVCPEYCSDLNEREYPRLNTSGMWFTYGRADGKIQINGTLNLTIQNGVTETACVHYSWDTYAFAFYFPSEEYALRCPKVFNRSPSTFKLTEVKHNSGNVTCFRKEKPPGRFRFVCPNEIHAVDLFSFRAEKRKRNDSPSDDEPEQKKLHFLNRFVL